MSKIAILLMSVSAAFAQSHTYQWCDLQSSTSKNCLSESVPANLVASYNVIKPVGSPLASGFLIGTVSGSTVTQNYATSVPFSLSPTITGSFFLGGSSFRWEIVYANNFNAVALNSGSTPLNIQAVSGQTGDIAAFYGASGSKDVYMQGDSTLVVNKGMTIDSAGAVSLVVGNSASGFGIEDNSAAGAVISSALVVNNGVAGKVTLGATEWAPLTTDTVSLGDSSHEFLGMFTKNLTITGTCTGCDSLWQYNPTTGTISPALGAYPAAIGGIAQIGPNSPNLSVTPDAAGHNAIAITGHSGTQTGALLYARAASGQTGDIADFLDSAGTVRLAIAANGGLVYSCSTSAACFGGSNGGTGIGILDLSGIYTSSILVSQYTGSAQVNYGTEIQPQTTNTVPLGDLTHTFSDANLTAIHVLGKGEFSGGLTNSSSRPSVGAGTGTGEYRGISSGGSANDDGFLRISAGGGTSASQKTYLDLSGYSTVSDMAYTMVFGINSAEKMRLNSAGLGIGLTGPNAILHALGPDANPGSSYGTAVFSGGTQIWQTRIGVNKTGGYGWVQTVEDGVSTIPLVLNLAGGNVGIGTASTSHTLEVSGTANISGAVAIGGTLNVGGNLTTNVTGSTQCLQVNSSGVVAGFGSGCGGSGPWSISINSTIENTSFVPVTIGTTNVSVNNEQLSVNAISASKAGLYVSGQASNSVPLVILRRPSGATAVDLAIQDSGATARFLASGAGTLSLSYAGTGNPLIVTNSGSAGTVAIIGAAIGIDDLSPASYFQNIIVQSMPTSCSGQPTGTLRNNSGVVNICP